MKKIAEELLAETRTPQQAFEYAIRREKGIEHSKTMKLNPIGPNPPVMIKQERMATFNPEEVVADFPQPSRTTIEEKPRVEDKTKTQGEIKIEVHKIKLHKNSATNVENLPALTSYNYAQPGIKFAQNAQNEDILRRSAVQNM